MVNLYRYGRVHIYVLEARVSVINMVFLNSNVLVTFLLTLFLSSSSYSVSAIPTLSARGSRTYPPNGAIVVKPSDATSGEFTSVQAAVNSLPYDMSQAVIFIYAGRAHHNRVFITQPMKWISGTYYEQVTISRPGPVTVCALRIPYALNLYPCGYRFTAKPLTRAAIQVIL